LSQCYYIDTVRDIPYMAVLVRIITTACSKHLARMKWSSGANLKNFADVQLLQKSSLSPWWWLVEMSAKRKKL